MTEETKYCPRCKRVRPIERFNRNKSRADGLHSWCTDCNVESNRRYFKTPAGRVAQRRANIRRYGLSLEEYEAISEKQGGLCAICRKPTGVRPNLDVDHDHSTNKVRGLLCQNCNKGIGLLDHNTQVLSQAKEYLQRGEL